MLLVGQREKLLAKLQDATDDQLVRFVDVMVQEQQALLTLWHNVKQFVDSGVVNAPPGTPLPKSDNPIFKGEPPKIDPPNKEVVNKKPPGKPVSKIGQENRKVILERLLKMPHSADEINGALRRGDGRLDDTEGLLALLWQRKEILYDGDLYHFNEVK